MRQFALRLKNQRLPLAKVLAFIFPLLVSSCVPLEPLREKQLTLTDGALPVDDQRLEEKLFEEDALAHERLVKGRKFYEDAAVEQYLHKIAEPFIQGLNIGSQRNFIFKIVRDPTLNAMTDSSGRVYYHSGVLARIENEAQLAFVLAHEISHVFHRDILYQDIVRDWWAKRSKWVDTLFNNPMNFSDYGMITDASLQRMRLISMNGFGQLFEARADVFAIEQIVKLGYDPSQAVVMIDHMIDEKERYDPNQEKEEIFFYSDHPSNVTRKKYLTRWILQHQELIRQSNATRLETQRFLKETYRIRQEDVKLNLDFNRYPQARDRALRLIEENPNDPVSYYYLGEVLLGLLKSADHLLIRKTGEEWREMTPEEKERNMRGLRIVTAASYRKAIHLDPKFPPPYRGLGMYLMQQGKLLRAKRYFEKYLELEPRAKDRRSILYYLNSEVAAANKPL